MRKLASIQRISNIRPIPNADKVECVGVLGWECVARKGEFSIGELVVYVEVDSIMPERLEFEFLRERKFRVRTIKLRGQISQGICFPLSIIPGIGKVKEGDDVSEFIGVSKYDPEAAKEAAEQAQLNARYKNRLDKYMHKYKWYRRYFTKSGKRGWPEWIKKTEEERIQNMPWICEKEQGTEFIITEKLDGTSATYALLRLPRRWWQLKDHFQFLVCSRNLYLRTKHKCNYWDIADQYDIERVLGNLIGMADFVILNYAQMEHHFGQNVLVHRKGATSAREGELGIIPGSQRTSSYIVRGKGNPNSFMSCSHGAGRKMGRKEAERTLNLADEQKKLDDRGILHAIRGVHDLDEAAGAYKDVEVVMKEQEDLVEIVTKLEPMAVVKG